MQLHNAVADRLTLGWVIQRHPEQAVGPGFTGLACTFVVKGTFRLMQDAPATAWTGGPDALQGDTLWPDNPQLGLSYPSDFVPWKPCGEWILVGSARPPRNLSAVDAGQRSRWTGDTSRPLFQVAAAVGESEKQLDVFGERHWQGILLHHRSEMQPLRDAVPLSYAYAWGGPGVPANPIGTGYGGGALPAFKRPGKPEPSYHDRRLPAGFGPLPSDWSPRAAIQGTHDDRWLASRWPWLPADIDYHFFLAAPSDQWVDGYFRGDESIRLVNLHPSSNEFRGLLPGMCPRLAVVRTDRTTDPRPASARPLLQPAEEVPLFLDTIWIDADREKLVLVWRGLTATVSPKLSDIVAVHLTSERLADRLAQGAVVPEPLPHVEDFGPQAVAGQPAAPEPAPETAGSQDSRSVAADRLDAALAEMMTAVERMTARLTSPDIAMPLRRAGATSPNAAVLLDGLAPRLAAETRPAPPGWAPETVRQALGIRDRMDELAAALRDSAEAAAAARSAAETLRRVPRLADGSVDVAEASRRGWQTLRLAGENLAGLDLAGIDLSGTDLSATDLSHANLAGGNLSAARLVKANLAGANLTGARLTAAQLSGANLSNATLCVADLSSCDLSSATVAAATWRGCRLSAAKLTGLDLSRADFSGCRADHADFTRTTLVEATFFTCGLNVATFSGARLDRAVFTDTALEWASFSRATAQEASFTECDVAKFRGGDAADFRRATFDRCRGEQAVFETSQLDGTRFVGCLLPRVRFAEASLVAAGFDRCDLRQAVFEDAALMEARIGKSNCFEAVFDRADLTRASLAGSNAYGSGFWESVIDGLDTAGANLAGTLLAGASIP